MNERELLSAVLNQLAELKAHQVAMLDEMRVEFRKVNERFDQQGRLLEILAVRSLEQEHSLREMRP